MPPKETIIHVDRVEFCRIKDQLHPADRLIDVLSDEPNFVLYSINGNKIRFAPKDR